MKIISYGLLFLLTCALAWPTNAQTKAKNKKTKAAKPTVKDDRVVSANPVIEGDPDVPEDRITIQQLKTKMDAGENILILDVRANEGWNTSQTKIKGALRVPMEDVDKKMGEWDKKKFTITYCS